MAEVGLKGKSMDFPGGSVEKNPPADVGDAGSIPGPGRFHVPGSNWIHVLQLLSLCSRAQKVQLWSPHALGPVLHNKRNHPNEKPAHRN